MSKTEPGEYYGIPYKQLGSLKCVMCGRNAEVIAPETNESLCEICRRNNDEARSAK